nr:PREDICTED: facilitated trehalose transporter Tret1-like isoform X1 [Bemisia tabaci]
MFKSSWLQQNEGYARQLLVCCSVSILPFVYGLVQTWPNLAIEEILKGEAGFAVDPEDIAVIVSMVTLGEFLMPILFGFVLVRLGRKTNMLLNALIYAVAWALIIFARSPFWLIAANFAAGLGCGIILIIGPIYMAEIADSKIRGALISVYITVIAIGQIFMTSVGIFISYFDMNLIALILSIVAFFCILVIAVESPSWHLIDNDEVKAEESFNYYWNTGEEADRPQAGEALAELKETVKLEMESSSSYLELFRTPSNIRASIIVITLSFFQGASGIVAVLTYGSTTLPRYDGFWKPYPTMALVSALNLVFNLVSIVLIDKLGRRPLSIVSNAGDALGTGIVAVYFFLEQNTEWDTTNIKWLPYIGMILYISSYGGAMAVIPHILVGELFPTNVRYHASVVSVICIAGSCALFNYIYLGVSRAVGVAAMFAIFTVCSFAAAVFSWLYVFETKNMSLSEIQAIMTGRRRTGSRPSHELNDLS